mmetsp:Transcript_32360/g.93803  ORF Transcript_32360/g.93803 Transcript_32360/m.93803 type:complete len:83 (-) Transcript_32360:112-360(-)
MKNAEREQVERGMPAMPQAHVSFPTSPHKAHTSGDDGGALDRRSVSSGCFSICFWNNLPKHVCGLLSKLLCLVTQPQSLLGI